MRKIKNIFRLVLLALFALLGLAWNVFWIIGALVFASTFYKRGYWIVKLLGSAGMEKPNYQDPKDDFKPIDKDL